MPPHKIANLKQIYRSSISVIKPSHLDQFSMTSMRKTENEDDTEFTYIYNYPPNLLGDSRQFNPNSLLGMGDII